MKTVCKERHIFCILFLVDNFLSAAHYSYISVVFGSISYQERNAPDSAKPDQCIDDSADHACLTAADPSNDVKLEDTD